MDMEPTVSQNTITEPPAEEEDDTAWDIPAFLDRRIKFSAFRISTRVSKRVFFNS